MVQPTRRAPPFYNDLRAKFGRTTAEHRPDDFLPDYLQVPVTRRALLELLNRLVARLDRMLAAIDAGLAVPALRTELTKLRRTGLELGGEQVKTRPRGVPTVPVLLSCTAPFRAPRFCVLVRRVQRDARLLQMYLIRGEPGHTDGTHGRTRAPCLIWGLGLCKVCVFWRAVTVP